VLGDVGDVEPVRFGGPEVSLDEIVGGLCLSVAAGATDELVNLSV